MDMYTYIKINGKPVYFDYYFIICFIFQILINYQLDFKW